MTPKDTPPEKDTAGKTESKSKPAGAPEHRKHRKHGYRGYPNKPDAGGQIHGGTGFAGVGPIGSMSRSGSGIITEKTRDKVEELGDEEKEKEKK
jgi:hypothetical protein